ncbi:MAG: alpha-glucuronidase family glycosyl hydrolase [Verrucomicrobiota bacterium]
MIPGKRAFLIAAGMTALLAGPLARAETGAEAWLRYAPLSPSAPARKANAVPAVVVTLSDSPLLNSARDEIVTGCRGMLGRIPRLERALPREDAVVLGTVAEVRRALPEFQAPAGLQGQGYCFARVRSGGFNYDVIAGVDPAGVLYGSFAWLRRLACDETADFSSEIQNPAAPVRMINQWDNLDGTIERGYGGLSIFWQDGHVAPDLNRASAYARLLASVGLNACCINNVNADARVITSDYIPELARVAAVFRPWGVRLYVCIDFSSPQKIGGLDTFDPGDARVAAFWKARVEEIYRAIPDFGGFVLKADSEGRLGPSAYGRTHADAANVIARALAPHGGLIFYRGFVYNHHMDWRDPKNDRARAACDNFVPLDGKFDDNALVQIKHGPIDFQVREPVSPLFGALEHTSQVIELQITQEYLGQQRHLCYLVPMWKEVLDFDLQAKGPGTPVKAVVAGKTFHRSLGGFVGVANVGRDLSWLGNPLAMANLYGFGRLAWNPDLAGRGIAEEWTRQTFGNDRDVVRTIVGLLMDSWPAYENYSGPLGAGTLTDIIGVHFGPGVESSERNGWGQWHRADTNGIGMDRTVATGTGFIGQYRPGVAKQYESLKSCPDELLLFFHHVPYTYPLHSGKTVIQHIYDTHYAGAASAQGFVQRWQSIREKVDEDRYRLVLDRLQFQAGHALVWRDAICQWFLKNSGIPDAKGRAGHYPGRVEAEDMRMSGYATVEVKPWETASKGKAAECEATNGQGSLAFNWPGPAGWFDVATQYYDQENGRSHYTLSVAGQPVDGWVADRDLPADHPCGHTATRRTTRGVALRPGDEVRIESTADGGERACVDYIQFEQQQKR